jgi:hypothetical protein
MREISEKREEQMNLALSQIEKFFDIGPNADFWKKGDKSTNVQRIRQRK